MGGGAYARVAANAKKGGRDPDQVSANSAKSASSHHLAKCEVPSKQDTPAHQHLLFIAETIIPIIWYM